MNLIKYPFYKLVKYLLNSSYFRECIWFSSKDIFCQNDLSRIQRVTLCEVPDEYTGNSKESNLSFDRVAPIFITGRFRSGSTFLWNLFRHIKGMTAYYEPLNENRWFASASENFKIDSTHLGVDDYHKEYTDMEDLEQLFDYTWSFRYLYMDERSYDTNLYKFINSLIQRAPGRPVLQFNRVDFRLPWLKANFPDAKIIHLFRNPREQWMSMQVDGGSVPQNFDYSHSTSPSLFYLENWTNDLRRIFPFLEPKNAGHPYAIHYYIWRLSYSFGKSYADYSISYESLVSNLSEVLEDLFDNLNLHDIDIERLTILNRGNCNYRWPEYAPASWFKEIEIECDRVLKTFYSNVEAHQGKFATIKYS